MSPLIKAVRLAAVFFKSTGGKAKIVFPKWKRTMLGYEEDLLKL